MTTITLNSKSEIKSKLNSTIAFSSQNYKLILKKKEFNLEIYNQNKDFNKSFIKIENNKHWISEVQKYGGWTGALQGLVRELWLREIEFKSETEILADKNKIFQRVINIAEKNELILQETIKNNPEFAKAYKESQKNREAFLNSRKIK